MAPGARIACLVVVGAVAFGAVRWWLTPPATAPVVPDAAPLPEAVRSNERVPDVPEALRGLEPSGGLTVGADGHFVPDRDALLFFEHFWSASNEDPIDRIVARIEAAIAERLDPPARGEAIAFLERFVAYRAAGDAEFRAPGVAGSAALERRFQWLRELRREHFGAEVAARLFGEEEDAVRVQLERRRVLADPTLEAEARRERLAALEDEFPDAVRAARAEATAPLRLLQDERALRAEGMGDAEIGALREDRFGRDAAERLSALDRERAVFDERLAAYRADRDARLAQARDAEERDAVRDEVLSEHFAPAERPRVRVLDRQEPPSAAY